MSLPSPTSFTEFLRQYHDTESSQSPPPIPIRSDSPEPRPPAAWPQWPTYRTWPEICRDSALPHWVTTHYDDPFRQRCLTALQTIDPPSGTLYYAIRQADACYRFQTHPDSHDWIDALEVALRAPRYRTLAQHWHQHHYAQSTAVELAHLWQNLLRTHPGSHPAFDSPQIPASRPRDASDSLPEPPASTAATLPDPPNSVPDHPPFVRQLATWEGLEAYADLSQWLDQIDGLIHQLDPTSDSFAVLEPWLAELWPDAHALHALIALFRMNHRPNALQ